MEFEKSDYVRRIANATEVQLVTIACEVTLKYLAGAKEALLEENEKEFHNRLTAAQNVLQEMSSSLNMEYPISWELLSLYLYVSKLFAQSAASNDVVHLDAAETILNNILEAWQGVEESGEGGKEPILENTEQVYAGLTYGRSGLDEFVVQDNDRGFKV